MIVLVDTSVWIEFFRRQPPKNIASLELLIEERRAATCQPIQTEVLSGHLAANVERVVAHAFEAMIHVDPDWNAPLIWNEIVHLSVLARRRRLRMPGIVDRMILIAAKTSGSLLWTLDRPLAELTEQAGGRLFTA